MSDSATLNHAAWVLASVAPDLPADVALRKYFADTKRLRPEERRAVSRAVFNAFRWFTWLNPQASRQKQVAEAWELQGRFERDPKSVKAEALAARAVPPWLAGEMPLSPEFLRHLQTEPSLWLRARPGTAARLSAELHDCHGTPRAPDALRYKGYKDLFRTPQFHSGAFEIQDLASQLVGHAARPQPGETWWDACAGEGGKMLHLADLMENRGLIWATDRSPRRLEVLKRRTARAKIFNYRVAPWDGSARLPAKTPFDGVLLDAPCSGVGTWHRNPHARWTVTPDDVRELAAIQASLLSHAAPAIKPGGRLVYAVCTLTRSETTAVADSFTAAHPEFEPLPVQVPEVAPQPSLFLWPQDIDANGMFVAVWRRKNSP